MMILNFGWIFQNVIQWKFNNYFSFFSDANNFVFLLQFAPAQISAIMRPTCTFWRTAQWLRATWRSCSCSSPDWKTSGAWASRSWSWSRITYSSSASTAWRVWVTSSQTSPSSAATTSSSTTPWSCSKWSSWRKSASTAWPTSREEQYALRRTPTSAICPLSTGPRSPTQWRTTTLWLTRMSGSAETFARVPSRGQQPANRPPSTGISLSVAGIRTIAKEVSRGCSTFHAAVDVFLHNGHHQFLFTLKIRHWRNIFSTFLGNSVCFWLKRTKSLCWALENTLLSLYT